MRRPRVRSHVGRLRVGPYDWFRPLSWKYLIMGSFWIAPAVAFAAVLMFSSPAKADKWGFSARVSHGRYASRDCRPRYSHHKTYRSSSYGHGDRHGARARVYYVRR